MWTNETTTFDIEKPLLAIMTAILRAGSRSDSLENCVVDAKEILKLVYEKDEKKA